MSIVGPRPLPVVYERLYTERERTRLAALPGITGWAQINGRQRIPFGQRLEYDAWYVENWSHVLDLKIMLLTIPRLVRRSDVMVGQEVEDVDDRGFADVWREFQREEIA
jgi:lipopolysaccharide/colanic/teichoic acid biosynthesis glycosyltransferase